LPRARSDKLWAKQYAWGCVDDATHAHKVGDLPAKRVSVFGRTAFYVEHYILFPDETAAKTAQDSLERARQDYAGTHPVAAVARRSASTDPVDF
jgi:hypothetical protein